MQEGEKRRAEMAAQKRIDCSKIPPHELSLPRAPCRFNLFSEPRGTGLIGLRNLGNTCYMNSSIQCLCNTTHLVRYFISNHYVSDINIHNVDGYEGVLAKKFAVIIKCMWLDTKQHRSILPKDFKSTVSRLNSMFAGNQQQDAHEFMDFLLSGLHEDLNEVVKKEALPKLENNRLSVSLAAIRTWSQHLKHHDSIFVELFQGFYRSVITCSHCGKQSLKFDIFNTTPLELPDRNSCTLQDCLSLYCKPGVLSDKWPCPRCKQPRRAYREIKFWKLPPILILNLKRLRMWTNKPQTVVHFPMEGFDANQFVDPRARRVEPYSLFSVVSLEPGGHYTAYCKRNATRSWYKFDDHRVTRVPEAQVVSAAAYTLFYTNLHQLPPDLPIIYLPARPPAGLDWYQLN